MLFLLRVSTKANMTTLGEHKVAHVDPCPKKFDIDMQVFSPNFLEMNAINIFDRTSHHMSSEI